MRKTRTTVLVVALAALTACHGRDGASGSPTPTDRGTRVTGSPTPTVGDLPPTTNATSGGTTTAPTAPDTTSTRQVVVRPVTAAGDLASGWTARTGSGSIDCSAGTRSPVAESDGVLDCAPAAASAVACWQARDHTHAYCLLDPRGRTLVRYTLAGAFGTAGPSELEPRPIALDLVGGARCTVRDSGAAGALTSHPDWVPYYYCGADGSQAAWGDPDSTDGGITRGDGRSTVALAPSDGSAAPKDTEVVTAYLVATA